MTYKDFLPTTETELVQNRYKITKDQDRRLRDIESRLNIPVSALVRLAIDTFLPKTTNNCFTEESIKSYWNESKF